MKRIDIMRERLQQALVPIQLVITDESAQHAGHVNAPESGESHFRLDIISDRFSGTL